MYQNCKDRKFLKQKNKSTRRPLKISVFEKLSMEERVGRELILSTACKADFYTKIANLRWKLFKDLNCHVSAN